MNITATKTETEASNSIGSGLRTDFEKRYRIDGILGAGGAGIVHAGYDHVLRRSVAIKRLRNDSDETTEAEGGLQLLLKEAEAMCLIQHPNIVEIYDFGIDREGVFIVMQLLDGFDFQELISDGALLMDQFKEIATQSLEGLVAAHAKSILHLDLKPANLILVWLPSGHLHVKIVDFGMARIHAKISAPDQTTKKLKLEGSIYFMSPEQFSNKELDQRSDLYSLGCAFYYALTGQFPFDGDTALQVMASHYSHRVTPLAQIRPDLPPWVVKWVTWLFEKDPDDRPSSSLDALDEFMENL